MSDEVYTRLSNTDDDDSYAAVGNAVGDTRTNDARVGLETSKGPSSEQLSGGNSHMSKCKKASLILTLFVVLTCLLAGVIQSWPYIRKLMKKKKPYADDIHNSDNGLDPDSLPMAFTTVVDKGLTFSFENSGHRRLKNALRPQCLIKDENNLVRTGSCGSDDVLYITFDEDTFVIRTHDHMCLSLSDQEAKGDDRLGMQLNLEPCDYHSFAQKWILGYNLDGQIFNQDAELCMDVEHQHYNAPVILWTCKLAKNYKPRNQMWHWSGSTLKERRDYEYEKEKAASEQGLLRYFR
ncbi:hypothetical protein SARC_10122 [Sphaeroforma arctica JP610]|uniref:Ricin B lectin domain-containing protein n=1 Tax=Sphaeroforma arctica JP610 TaxID=667725 RepID=A0A0L0FKV0_9EUKA|nr:hypothetical protein SARC_10122 [Sphaeroforma arctica JP610]KNC77417.1 hypothetical protein SARC_10122 [Sphaeroforma arctica JP610]|eukprot:XP_014151319.1 hypothetical protein SARC_10122 [Sphaeroforma arctica JP610]